MASEAGVNQSLIHYYFGTKDGLILAVLEDMNRELLERQTRMYETPDSFSDKWAQACRFFEEDLASGWVPLIMELSGLGLANPAIAAEVRKINAPWRALIRKVAARALDHFGVDGLSPDEVTAFLVCFWRGMELDLMLGVPEAEGHHRQSLQSFERLLRWLEAERASIRAPALGPQASHARPQP